MAAEEVNFNLFYSRLERIALYLSMEPTDQDRVVIDRETKKLLAHAQSHSQIIKQPSLRKAGHHSEVTTYRRVQNKFVEGLDTLVADTSNSKKLKTIRSRDIFVNSIGNRY